MVLTNTKPLLRCINTIKQIQSGNLKVKLHKAKRLDEIGDLDRTIVKMLDSSINLIRVKNGLDHTLNPLMIIDTDGKILFKNNPAEVMISMNAVSSNVTLLSDFDNQDLSAFLKGNNHSTTTITLAELKPSI